jgi:hypothetical protein
MAWILGRIYSTGTPDDYAAVHALQDKFATVPLSAYGKPYAPPPGVIDPAVDMKTAVRKRSKTSMSLIISPLSPG